MPRTVPRRRRDDPDEDYGPSEQTGSPRRRRAATRDDDDQRETRSRRTPRMNREVTPDRGGRPARRDRSRAPSQNTTTSTASGGRGWAAYQKAKSEMGAFPETFRPTDEAVIVKFLESVPFFTYRQHWLDEAEGKKSFVCLGDACPLCDDLGDNPALRVCFNILDYSDPDNPTVKVWAVGSRLAQIIEQFSEDKKTSPLDRDDLFWAVSKSGKGTKTSHSLVPVKERDLEEDWGLDADAAYDALDDSEGNLHDESFIHVNSRDELADLANDILDEAA